MISILINLFIINILTLCYLFSFRCKNKLINNCDINFIFFVVLYAIILII